MSLKKLFSILTLTGWVLFLYSLTLPLYTDENLLSLAITETWGYQSTSRYYELAEQLTTYKLLSMDIGTWLIIFSISILIFLSYSGIHTLSELKQLKSCSRWKLFLIMNIAGVSLFPGTIWYYTFRLFRWDYPPMSDTIIIPIRAGLYLDLILFVLMNIILIIGFIRSVLPVMIGTTPKKYTFFVMILEIFFWGLIVISTLIILSAIIDGDHFLIPISLIFLYSIAVLRASSIALENQKVSPETPL